MTTVIDRLKVRGGPPPRKLSNSSSKSARQRPAPDSMIALERSYRLLLNGSQSLDIPVHGIMPVAKRMDSLSRVRQANNAEPEVVISETPVLKERNSTPNPNFLLCGLSVTSKGLNVVDPRNYKTDQRVGSYKTSAKEVYRARQSGRIPKAKSESGVKDQDVIINDEDDNSSLPSSCPTLTPSTPVSMASTSKMSTSSSMRTSLELTGHSLKGPNNAAAEEWNTHGSPDCLILRTPRKLYRATRREYTNDQLDSGSNVGDNKRQLRQCLHVQQSKQLNSAEDPEKKPRYYKSFVKKGIKVNYNNPYRNIKHKERQALASSRNYEFTTVQSYINFNKAYHQQNGPHIILPKSVLRVPNPCSDTFLLQMMLEINKPKSRKSSTMYSERSSPQKSLGDFMNTPTPRSKSSLTNDTLVAEEVTAARSNHHDVTEKQSNKNSILRSSHTDVSGEQSNENSSPRGSLADVSGKELTENGYPNDIFDDGEEPEWARGGVGDYLEKYKDLTGFSDSD